MRPDDNRLANVIPKLTALCDAVEAGYQLPPEAMGRIEAAAADTLALCREEVATAKLATGMRDQLLASINRCEHLLGRLRFLASLRSPDASGAYPREFRARGFVQNSSVRRARGGH